jgi:DNA polymerase-3 subunit delta
MSRKAVALLAQHLGNNLSRIVNEIEKVTVNLGGRTTITEEDIENFVGVSKDYNAFELQEALSRKDLPKALQIIQYFESNPKAGPIQMILPALYGYFSRVYALFGLKVMSEEMARPIFYNNSFAARDAVSAARKYQLDGLEKVLLLLHEYNLRSLGINDAGTSDAELMKELAVKIMNC